MKSNSYILQKKGKGQVKPLRWVSEKVRKNLVRLLTVTPSLSSESGIQNNNEFGNLPTIPTKQQLRRTRGILYAKVAWLRNDWNMK